MIGAARHTRTGYNSVWQIHVTATAALSAPAPSSDRVDLALEGMTCAACAARIEKTLNRLPGVAASVNFATESAQRRLRSRPRERRRAARGGRRVPATRRTSSDDDDAERAREKARKARGLAARCAASSRSPSCSRCRSLRRCSSMLASRDATHAELCRAGCSLRSRRRCSSWSAGASTSAHGMRCAAAAPTWTS